MRSGKEYDIFMVSTGERHCMVENNRPNMHAVAVHDSTLLILLQSSNQEREGNSINVIYYYSIHYHLLAYLYVIAFKSQISKEFTARNQQNIILTFH